MTNMTIIYKSILKDLTKTLADLKARGITVEKFNGYINSRKAFYINGELMTDYEIIEANPRQYII